MKQNLQENNNDLYTLSKGVNLDKLYGLNKKIADVLNDNPDGLTKAEIAEKIKFKEIFVTNILNALEKLEIIEKSSTSSEEPESDEELDTNDTEEETDIEDTEDTEDTEDEEDIEDEPNTDDEEELEEPEPVAPVISKSMDKTSSEADELAKLIKQKDKLISQYKNKEITLDQYKSQIGDLPKKIKALQDKLASDLIDDEDTLDEVTLYRFKRISGILK
jgi:hypothetical protein